MAAGPPAVVREAGIKSLDSDIVEPGALETVAEAGWAANTSCTASGLCAFYIFLCHSPGFLQRTRVTAPFPVWYKPSLTSYSMGPARYSNPASRRSALPSSVPASLASPADLPPRAYAISWGAMHMESDFGPPVP